MPDKNAMNALLLGDIFGKPGSRAIFVGLKPIIKKYRADFVIANGENIADGFGITPDLAESLFSQGIAVITTGNHVWQKREILPALGSREGLLRPANYPPGAPGKGFCVIDVKGEKIAVINLQGREKMSSIDCPFRSAKEILKRVRQETRSVFVDFHAESTEEKEALAFFLDGSVTAIVGTHTHVQTADERILPKGTAYITDLGMTGPASSVIGVSTETAIKRSLTQMPLKMDAADSEAMICGVVVQFRPDQGRALSIERFRESLAC
jgi:metallophosphoesterase (TIGR00282 family)